MNRVPIPWSNAIVLSEAIDDITENDWFTDDELAIANGFKREARRREWILSRIAAKQLAVERGLFENAKDCRVEAGRVWVLPAPEHDPPHPPSAPSPPAKGAGGEGSRLLLPGAPVPGSEARTHVSLSHSGPYAAAAIDRVPVGIDVQVVRDLSQRAARLFLSDDEADAMNGLAVENRILHYWCAKEAAWKAHGGSIPTMKQIQLKLREVTVAGLRFDSVETFATGDLVIALTVRSTP